MDRKQLDRFAKSIRAVPKSPAKRRVAVKGYIIKVRIFPDNPWTAESELCVKTKDGVIRPWFGINLRNVLLTILSLLVIVYLIGPYQFLACNTFLSQLVSQIKTQKSNQVICPHGDKNNYIIATNILNFPHTWKLDAYFNFQPLLSHDRGVGQRVYFVHHVKLID